MKAERPTQGGGRGGKGRRCRKSQAAGRDAITLPGVTAGQFSFKPPYTQLDAYGVREGGCGKSCGETFPR